MTVGELVRTRRGWVITAPTRCPAGHALEPGSMLVGHVPCAGPMGGHTTWTCACGATVYAPAVGSDCVLLHGASVVRNL